MKRFLLLLLTLLALAAPAQADDISDAYGGVARVIVVLSFGEGDEYVAFGSGFAVGPTQIVTNYHVVEEYAQYAGRAETSLLAVVPSRGTRPLQARLLIYDSAKDLAVLQLVQGTMEPMTLFSGAPDVGQRYTALGFPANVDMASAGSEEEMFNATVTPRAPIRTSGDISDARPVHGVEAYVHDADIAGGNSGGPLVDQCGRVIGVNSAVAGASESDSASSFAISYRELARFLRRAEISFRSESDPCVTSEDRGRICTRQREDARTQALSECMSGIGRDAAAAEHDYQRQQEAARRNDETMMFVAFALMLFGALALGAGGVLLTRDQRRYAIWSGAGGAALILAAIVVFAVRPSAADIDEPESEARDCRAQADQVALDFESEDCPAADEEEQNAGQDAAAPSGSSGPAGPAPASAPAPTKAAPAPVPGTPTKKN